MDDLFLAGIQLFNAGKFFECHEALEALWLKTQGDEKTFLHGLIQIAAAFHHHTRRNPAGFRSLLEKGLKKLERFGGRKSGIDLDGLRNQLRALLEFPDVAGRGHGREAPRLPRIKISRVKSAPA